MEDGRPSMTAFIVAALRAHHQLSAPAPRILEDSLAMRLAGLASPAEVRAFVETMTQRLTEFGGRSEAEAKVRRMMTCTCVRSRFFEDQLAASLRRGMKQLVVLGAGLDSTACRRADITDGMTVFEVDHPATQAWKRDRLAAIDVPLPGNLAFVPFDFERQTLAEALAAGGVQADAMTFFSWLGVQPYLTDETVLSTLDVIAAFPSGSELVMDLLTPDNVRRDDGLEQGGRRLLASMGEPFRSSYAPDRFRACLQDRGFADIDMVGFQDWLLRHAARFQGRFSADPGPMLLVAAQVA